MALRFFSALMRTSIGGTFDQDTFSKDDIDAASSRMNPYLWGVSRYDHLNPVPALVAHPADWPVKSQWFNVSATDSLRP